MSSTNRGATRVESDYYPTPQWAIDLILREIDWQRVDSFLEPCAGDFRILKAIGEGGFWSGCRSEWCEINTPEQRDYFKHSYWEKEFDLIVTNPPYSMVKDFVEMALHDAKSVAMLLRLGFLGSVGRHAWWQGKEPSRLFVLSKRPSFTGKGTDSADYAWFCWGDAFIRDPGIYMLKPDADPPKKSSENGQC